MRTFIYKTIPMDGLFTKDWIATSCSTIAKENIRHLKTKHHSMSTITREHEYDFYRDETTSSSTIGGGIHKHREFS